MRLRNQQSHGSNLRIGFTLKPSRNTFVFCLTFFSFLALAFFSLSPFRSLSICRLFFSGSFHCLRFLILCRLNVLFDFPNSFVVSFVSFHLFYLSPFSFLFLFSSGCPCTYVCILSLSPSFSFRPFLPLLNHTFLLLLLPFFLFGSGAWGNKWGRRRLKEDRKCLHEKVKETGLV